MINYNCLELIAFNYKYYNFSFFFEPGWCFFLAADAGEGFGTMLRVGES